MTQVTITDRLAIGLAREAIRKWRAEVARGQKRLIDLMSRDLSTGKAARRLARDIESALRPVAFKISTVQLGKRGIFQYWIVPEIVPSEHGDYLRIDVQYALTSVNGHRPLSEKAALLIHSHALARLFLRLQSAERADVQAEIGSSLLIATALPEACARLGLRQMVFPTRSGAFRCDVVQHGDGAGAAVLAAKTWISYQTVGARDQAVAVSVLEALNAWRETVNPPELAPILLLMEAQMPEALVDILCAALDAYDWLKEPYVERPDHLSQLWAAAREQANAPEA